MAYHYIIPEDGFDPKATWEKIEAILPEKISVWLETGSSNADTKVYCIPGQSGVAIAALSKSGPLEMQPINYKGATIMTKDEEKITDAYGIPFKVSGSGQIYVNMFGYEIFKGLNEELKKLVKKI